MKQALLLLALFWTAKCVGQPPNYEQKALLYFQSDTVLQNKLEHQCDCREKFDKTFPFLFFDSVYLRIDIDLALSKLQIKSSNDRNVLNITTDSLNKIIFISSTNVKRAMNAKDFRTGHYLVRFSERIHVGNEVIIEMLVKSRASCSGINYYFSLGPEGNIIRAIPMIWCDSQG